MPLLGCIADDFTGATDLANMLVREGLRTVQTIGVPRADFDATGVDAVVVALKSRTIPAAEAVAHSLEALDWLRAAGCSRFFFKYCSTFDSTADGNIGPVAEALQEALGVPLSIACPAFPETGRTVYQGHLFVGDRLLNDSGMEHHPLTPMSDPDLVRVLGAQATGPVGLVRWDTVAAGAGAVRAALDALAAAGHRHAIVDALEDAHLRTIGAAVAGDALVTGGSGVALGLPAAWKDAGLLHPAGDAARLPPVAGAAAVVAGSCSRATRAQVAYMKARRPAYEVDPLKLAAGADEVGAAVAFARSHLESGPVLVYATAAPDSVRAIQKELGVARAGALVEDALAAISRALVHGGVRRLVVAGGETSGAVVGALGVEALRIGPQICPGVPWTAADGRGAGVDGPLALALKSGNFGAEDFFLSAFEVLP